MTKLSLRLAFLVLGSVMALDRAGYAKPVSGLVVTPVNISPAEGMSFNGTVANFTDTDTSQPASNFTATIGWGDGTTTAGGVSGSAGSFAVSGTHTYADEGAYTVTVAVTDTANALNSSSTGTATVAEADALNGTGLTFAATQGVAFNGDVANFTDTYAANTANDFSATINWGDTVTSAGVVTSGGGALKVSGSHTYASQGTFTVTTTLTDDAPGTATGTAIGSAVVGAPGTPTNTPTNTPTSTPTRTPTNTPTNTPTTTPTPVVVVPTLNESGMLIFGLLIAAAGLLLLIRRR